MCLICCDLSLEPYQECVKIQTLGLLQVVKERSADTRHKNRYMTITTQHTILIMEENVHNISTTSVIECPL